MSLSHHKLPLGQDGRPLPAFAELTKLPGWLCWGRPVAAGAKISKAPISALDGSQSGWREKRTSYATATAYAAKHGLAGVGFLANPKWNLVFGDIDRCVVDGKLQPWAREIIGKVPETYCEFSPSGTGLRFVARGAGKLASKNADGTGVELHSGDGGNFVTLTGRWIKSSPGDLNAAPETIKKMYVRAGLEPGAIKLGAKPGIPHPAAITMAESPFQQLNDIAVARLDDWFQLAFPQAQRASNGAWRLSPPDLGRHSDRGAAGNALTALQSLGIRDFYADHGGEKAIDEWGSEAADKGSRTPIDMLLPPYAEHAADGWGGASPGDAALKLCEALDLPQWFKSQFTATIAFAATGPQDPFVDPEIQETPAWPAKTLPDVIERHATQVAGYLGANPDAGRFAFLVALANCVPAGINYDVHGNGRFMVHAGLYAALVGDPGSAKTPLVNAALKPLQDIEARWAADHGAKMAAHAALGKAAPDAAPSRRRKTINNATLEAVAKILHENPDGVFVTPDELTGWLGSIDRYQSGGRGGSAESAFWLSAAEAKPYSFDRVTGGRSFLIPRAHVGILGGIQPAVLGKIIGELGGDGLIQRFVFGLLDQSREPDRAGLDGPAAGVYRDAVEALLMLDTGEGMVLKASPGAAEVNFAAERWKRQRCDDATVPLVLKGFYAKVPGLHGRLTLALAMADWAVAQAELDGGGFFGLDVPLPDTVNEATALRAWRLLEGYLAPCATNVLTALGGAAETRHDARVLASWLLRRPEGQRELFTAREIYTAVRKFRGKAGRALLIDATAELEALDWLTFDTAAANQKTLQWRMNPQVYDGRFDRHLKSGGVL